MDHKINSKINLRRLRQDQWIRELTKEHRVSLEQLIQPYFVVEGLKDRETIAGITGTFRDNSETLARQIESDLEAGVRKVLLFGVPARKNLSNFDPSFTAREIEKLRKRFGQEIWISTDVCLCSSTTHGQCGVVNDAGDHIDNAASVAELAKASVAYAQAGADCVAPSDMMDGRIAAIRGALDSAGLERTVLMSYAAKFHSKFYGPFRAAADSAPKGNLALKDRATYQLDPANFNDALESSLRDAREGADILMVKPGLPYLDVLAKLSAQIHKPWAVYEVSGEFASIELMAREGLMNGPQAHVEAWTSFVRAGARIIITYGARYAQNWLKS